MTGSVKPEQVELLRIEDQAQTLIDSVLASEAAVRSAAEKLGSELPIEKYEAIKQALGTAAQHIVELHAGTQEAAQAAGLHFLQASGGDDKRTLGPQVLSLLGMS
ncbi:MAG: hypothetical protein AAGJ87_06150 [Pseudomonadota bacterium]